MIEITSTSSIELTRWKADATRLKAQLDRINGIVMPDIDLDAIVFAANDLKFNRSEHNYINYVNATHPDVVLKLIARIRHSDDHILMGRVEIAENDFELAMHRVSQLENDVDHLVLHAANMGIALRDEDHDLANESWESLPDHLQKLVNGVSEKIDQDAIIDEETGESL